MATERLVAVSYPADKDYSAINSEILGGAATLAYSYELSDSERLAVLQRAEVLLAWELAKELPPGALHQAPDLRFVQLLSAGVDAIDFSALPSWPVFASNAGAYAPEMAEHVLAMALSLAKRLPQRHAAMAAGRFEKWHPSLVLEGAVCGILGFGGIGVATARLMRAFGARIYAVNRTGETSEPVEFAGTLADLDLVLSASDVIVISLPLTLTTRGLLGKRELSLLKPTAIVVNVARGAIIDQAALYEFLSANPQAGAGIDTWWHEPAGDSPFQVDYPFFELSNVIGSPHNSSIVPGTMLAAARVAAQNVLRYLHGDQIAGVVRREDYVPDQDR
jgi:phosphoglycerate dehydrogenase-like enzyme